jgi:hypothetical protein
MLDNVIELLKLSEYKNTTERIEIAKGKYQLPRTWKDVWYKIKRDLWQTKPSK